jgi:hypothetical protein
MPTRFIPGIQRHGRTHFIANLKGVLATKHPTSRAKQTCTNDHTTLAKYWSQTTKREQAAHLTQTTRSGFKMPAHALHEASQHDNEGNAGEQDVEILMPAVRSSPSLSFARMS